MNKLYNDLLEAYSNKNLNRITGKLIELYRNKNFAEIRGIANRISRYILIDEEKDAKCFSKLIMLYHPDRGEFFKNAIQQLYAGNDLKGLEKYSHIFLINNIDEIKVAPVDEDIDYHPEYIWDEFEFDGYHEVNYNGYSDYDGQDSFRFERSFYNAMVVNEFGIFQNEYSDDFLADFEEIELAYSGLDSLDGIEFCIRAVLVDASGNQISDISNLWNLSDLEELYLANNHIGFIDALSNLLKLRRVDLSGNDIEDISPLFELENLEYLNLAGNRIPQYQIDLLRSRNIIVMC